VFTFWAFMAARAKKAAANFIRTLKTPCSVRFSVCVLLFAAFGLLLRCGDVEVNPGPDTNMETSTSASEDTGNEPSVSLSDISKKLEQIMKEQKDMKRTINERFAAVEDRLRDRLDDMDSRVQTATDDIVSLNEKLECLYGENESLKKHLEEQDNKLDYMENQSRRQNLLFHNMPKEKENETWEDCEWAVQDVLRDVLGAGIKVAIDRAHRVGSAIIVRFASYKDKECILRQGYKFKGTNIGVSEDFSRQVREKRKGLIPLMKSYHKDKKRATLVMDKLRTPDGVFTFDLANKQIEQVGPADPPGAGASASAWRPGDFNRQRTPSLGEGTMREGDKRRRETSKTINERTTQSRAFSTRDHPQRQTPLETRDNRDRRLNDQSDHDARAKLRGFGRGSNSSHSANNNNSAFRFGSNSSGSRGGGWWYRGRGRGSPRRGVDDHGSWR
jgi:hypothetical protein